MTDEKSKDTEPKGEGSYEGAKKFREAQHEFVKSGDVKEKAREAAKAVEGEEKEALEKARKDAANGPD